MTGVLSRNSNNTGSPTFDADQSYRIRVTVSDIVLPSETSRRLLDRDIFRVLGRDWQINETDTEPINETGCVLGFLACDSDGHEFLVTAQPREPGLAFDQLVKSVRDATSGRGFVEIVEGEPQSALGELTADVKRGFQAAGDAAQAAGEAAGDIAGNVADTVRSLPSLRTILLVAGGIAGLVVSVRIVRLLS